MLRLLEDCPLARLRQAVKKALAIRAHSRQAIAQFLIPHPSRQWMTFKLDGHEHLRHVRVVQPDLSLYRTLLSDGGIT